MGKYFIFSEKKSNQFKIPGYSKIKRNGILTAVVLLCKLIGKKTSFYSVREKSFGCPFFLRSKNICSADANSVDVLGKVTVGKKSDLLCWALGSRTAAGPGRASHGQPSRRGRRRTTFGWARLCGLWGPPSFWSRKTTRKSRQGMKERTEMREQPA
jgi:hypothetical protein